MNIWHAEEKYDAVLSVNQSSVVQNPDQNAPVAVSVLIDLERQVLRLLNQEKLLWSANIAEKVNSSPLRIPPADFAHLVAHTITTAEQITHSGRVVSHQLTMPSTPPLSGNNAVTLYGGEIAALAADAGAFTEMASRCFRYITSEAAQSSQNSEQALKTLSCCVAAVITSYIPALTPLTSSFAIKLTTNSGWTYGQADSARYRQLGNAVAVPVARWIGRQIMRFL